MAPMSDQSDLQIREERQDDQEQIRRVQTAAFADAELGGLVDALREASPAAEQLSLVAVDGERVIGHVMFTPSLLDAPARLVQVKVLSPVGVLPERQRQGVGSALISRGLDLMNARGAPMVFLEGAPRYYRRFGFVAGAELGFRKPSLRIPDEAFQVRVLDAYEPWMTGTLVYAQIWWDLDFVGLRPPS